MPSGYSIAQRQPRVTVERKPGRVKGVEYRGFVKAEASDGAVQYRGQTIADAIRRVFRTGEDYKSAYVDSEAKIVREPDEVTVTIELSEEDAKRLLSLLHAPDYATSRYVATPNADMYGLRGLLDLLNKAEGL